jgi:hypothetical protein
MCSHSDWQCWPTINIDTAPVAIKPHYDDDNDNDVPDQHNEDDDDDISDQHATNANAAAAATNANTAPANMFVKFFFFSMCSHLDWQCWLPININAAPVAIKPHDDNVPDQHNNNDDDVLDRHTTLRLPTCT